jgi:hypothetical protein
LNIGSSILLRLTLVMPQPEPKKQNPRLLSE